MSITRTLNRLAKRLKPVGEKPSPYICWGCGKEYKRKSPTYPICNECGGEIWTREELEGWQGVEDDDPTPGCSHCGREDIDLIHLRDDKWVCPQCNHDYYMEVDYD